MRAASGGTRVDPAGRLEAAIACLLRAQGASGVWTDFWLPVGTSDAWVSAFVGLALDAAARCPALSMRTRARARRGARRAARWLLALPRPQGGWGFNSRVAADADSTAHVVSLLARVGEAVPEEAVDFLRSHRVEGGFRTYRFSDPHHEWTRPAADVTAAALRALVDAGRISQEELTTAWHEILLPLREPDGTWRGYWWAARAYPTAMALEVRAAIGRLGSAEDGVDPNGARPGSPFELAWTVHAQALGGEIERARVSAARLLASQQADGGWPAAAILRIPPSHPGARDRGDLCVRDARRLFTTASALRVLARHPGLWTDAGADVGKGKAGAPRLRLRRSSFGRSLDRRIEAAALALGFDADAAREEAFAFRRLTQRSLRAPTLYPSNQISALAGGLPVELSVDAGCEIRPALRYAAEVGDPRLSSEARTISALAAIEAHARWRIGAHHTADAGGIERVLAAARTLLPPLLAAPEGTRFRVWGGIDADLPDRPTRSRTNVLKLYLNLLEVELCGGGRRRMEAALAGARIPVSGSLRAMFNLLDDHGYPHEIGFGLVLPARPGGAGADVVDRFACKIYYELPGWRRDVAGELLRLAGLPRDPDGLVPEIPGILRESLAMKSRAGIAVRVDPSDGRPIAWTSAAAFPVPMLTPRETARRVAAWIDAQGWESAPYRALAGLLLPEWEAADAASATGHVRMHSLFTRTVGARGRYATIYLRPPGVNPGSPSRRDSSLAPRAPTPR